MITAFMLIHLIAIFHRFHVIKAAFFSNWRNRLKKLRQTAWPCPLLWETVSLCLPHFIYLSLYHFNLKFISTNNERSPNPRICNSPVRNPIFFYLQHILATLPITESWVDCHSMTCSLLNVSLERSIFTAEPKNYWFPDVKNMLHLGNPIFCDTLRNGNP